MLKNAFRAEHISLAYSCLAGIAQILIAQQPPTRIVRFKIVKT